MYAAVVDVPELGALVLGVPLVELVAEAEDAFLGPRLLLVATGSAEGCIELILVQRIEQSLCLHQVGMHLAAMREGSYASAEGLHVALHNQVPAVLLGIAVAELYHLAELPFRVDVHQGERHLAGCKGLLGQAHHDAGVLTYTIQHDRILELGSHLTNDVDALGLQFLQMRQTVFTIHISSFVMNSQL